MADLWLVRIRRPQKEYEYKTFKRESRAHLFRNKLMSRDRGYILGVDIRAVHYERLPEKG